MALTPAFAAGTTAYRAWVANSVSAVTVDATANDSNATVGVTGHSSLSAGRNAIEVLVTAEDGLTTETYTVTLVRAAGAPTADPDALLTANVTAGEVNEATPGSLLGYSFIGGRNERGAMSNRPFQVGGNNNSMRAVLAVGGAAVSQFQANSLYFCAQSALPAGDLATLSAEVGGVSYGLASATILDISGGETCYFWPRGGLSVAWGDVVLVKLIQAAAANNPATGAPAISGTETVGETLTASTAGIADDDGLTTATYTYQWIRVDTSDDETDITGAASDTYELVDADEGATIKVRVSFTDDAGNDEVLTSDATGQIAAADTAPPELGTISVNGDTITLTYSEALNESSVPDAARFFVFFDVSDEQTVSGVQVTGTQVILTLAAAATSENQVGVRYIPDASEDGIEDTSGNDAAGFTELDITNNTPDTRAPELETAEVNGDTLTLTYDEALDETSTPAAGAFTVTVEGSAVSVSNVAVSGMAVTLTLGAAADAREAVSLDYAPPGASPIRDAAENPAAALTGETVTNNTPDTRAPELETAEVNGDTLTLTYDEALDETSTPAAGAFTVTVEGSAVSVSNVAVSGMAVTLTLGAAADAREAVSLDYAPPGASPIRDAAENPAAALTGETVTNNTPDTRAPELETAEVNGDTLTLTYDEALDETSTPAAGAFTVTVEGSAVSVSNVAVSGMAVTLTLGAAADAREAVSPRLRAAKRQPDPRRGGEPRGGADRRDGDEQHAGHEGAGTRDGRGERRHPHAHLQRGAHRVSGADQPELRRGQPEQRDLRG